MSQNEIDDQVLALLKGDINTTSANESGTNNSEPSSELSNLSEDYGSDLIIDERDRLNLLELTEVEREALLSERADKRQQKLEKQELKKKLKQAKKTKSKTVKEDFDSAKSSNSSIKKSKENQRSKTEETEEGTAIISHEQMLELQILKQDAIELITTNNNKEEVSALLKGSFVRIQYEFDLGIEEHSVARIVDVKYIDEEYVVKDKTKTNIIVIMENNKGETKLFPIIMFSDEQISQEEYTRYKNINNLSGCLNHSQILEAKKTKIKNLRSRTTKEKLKGLKNHKLDSYFNNKYFRIDQNVALIEKRDSLYNNLKTYHVQHSEPDKIYIQQSVDEIEKLHDQIKQNSLNYLQKCQSEKANSHKTEKNKKAKIIPDTKSETNVSKYLEILDASSDCNNAPGVNNDVDKDILFALEMLGN